MTAFTPGARALCLVFLICLLAGCASQQGGRATSPADAARAAAAAGHYRQAAQLYMQAAQSAANPKTGRRMRLAAGAAAAQGGQAKRARAILAPIRPAALSANDRARYKLARTEIRIATMAPGEALTHLPAPTQATPSAVAQRVLEKRADLYFAGNQPIEGIRSLVRRDQWLIDPRATRANDNRIYDKALDAIALGLGPRSRPAADAGAATRGWLALAAIGQSEFSNRAQRDRALARWQSQYPNHPAGRTVLAQRFHYHAGPPARPVHPRTPGPAGGPVAPGGGPVAPAGNAVVLALPTTGAFANAAQAIRDGFMFAYRRGNSSLAPPRFVDSSGLAARGILARARQNNAGIVVGPLAKPKVAALARLRSHIPVLALNHTDAPVNRPNFYQFALSPEDEARAVARHALTAGHSRALALVPGGGWGHRVLKAFRARFANGGGHLVDRATYDENTHDHSGPIKRLLRGYHRNPASVDFIFVAARPVQGRLIRSQLRFYHASALPMLSTSLIYTGHPRPKKDIDLNGVHFVDMPWILGHGPTIARRRKAANQRFNEAASAYAPLFAMGMDAWLLTAHIATSGLRPGDAFEGMTGVLSVAPNHRIRRYLAWAVFDHGRPRLLQMPSTGATDQHTTALNR